MTFRVADLMIQPIAAAGRKGRGKKVRMPKDHPPCGNCTVGTDCGLCSLCTDCTQCTNCTACTCTRCSHYTALSTCTGLTDTQDCACAVTSARNLAVLQAALQSKVQSMQSVQV